MRFPKKGRRIDKKHSAAIIHRALKEGVTYFDTALPYHDGESEAFMGKVLAEYDRDVYQLATKLPPWSVKSRGDMDVVLQGQLQRLNTDYLDFYLLHALDGISWNKMKELQVVAFLDSIRKKGLVRQVGFSFHGNLSDFKTIVDEYRWDFCQIQYNYLDEYHQAGLEGLNYAASKDLGVVVMEPLLGGRLATSIPDSVMEVWGRAPYKRSPVEWALRWVWNHPQVSVVLSGMSSMEQLEENVSIAGEASPDSLTETELQCVDTVKKAYQKLGKTGCTGCGYCMPCPSGVNIPLCFELYDGWNIFHGRSSKMHYTVFLGGLLGSQSHSYASRCTKCGVCLEKCPQNIDIPTKLDDVAKVMEGLFAKVLTWAARMFLFVMRKKALKIKKG